MVRFSRKFVLAVLVFLSLPTGLALVVGPRLGGPAEHALLAIGSMLTIALLGFWLYLFASHGGFITNEKVMHLQLNVDDFRTGELDRFDIRPSLSTYATRANSDI